MCGQGFNINAIPSARTKAAAETLQIILFPLEDRNNRNPHLCLCALRIVNYEAGKGASKARSLWRLEPLRIRWDKTRMHTWWRKWIQKSQ